MRERGGGGGGREGEGQGWREGGEAPAKWEAARQKSMVRSAAMRSETTLLLLSTRRRSSYAARALIRCCKGIKVLLEALAK